MKVYSVFDDQFELFSDPFLCADDSAAERLIVQTALASEGFRKRLSLISLYAVGSFEPATLSYKMPMRSFKRPELVSGGSRLSYLAYQCELSDKYHLSSVSSVDSEEKEHCVNE